MINRNDSSLENIVFLRTTFGLTSITDLKVPLAVSVSCDWKITSQVRTGDPFSHPQITVYSYSQTAFLTCCKVVQEEET